MALSELILAAVVRIGSNPRVFRPTPTPEEVFRFVEALTSPTEVRRIEPGPRHWMIFRGLVLDTGIRGSDTPTPTWQLWPWSMVASGRRRTGASRAFPGSAGAISPREGPGHLSSLSCSPIGPRNEAVGRDGAGRACRFRLAKKPVVDVCLRNRATGGAALIPGNVGSVPAKDCGLVESELHLREALVPTFATISP